MKSLSPYTLSVCMALAVLTLLSACSGSGSTGTSSLPSSATRSNQMGSMPTRSGLTVQLERTIQIVNHSEHRSGPDLGGLRELYVTSSNGIVEILKNNTWANAGSISSGINDPWGDWVDKVGNLYVANDGAGTVTEYARHATSPTFTYSSGMYNPFNVTTDSNRNVYEADGNGAVNEYAHRSNKVIRTCAVTTYGVYGVAVDGSGDVFVDTLGGSIFEYRGSLKGCSAIRLGASISEGGGMVLDNHNNLIVCDVEGAVDVIDPPYKRISGHLGSGYYYPVNVTLNKTNTKAYVADDGAFPSGVVDVLNYPTGSLITSIGYSNGVIGPRGAVDGRDFVP